MKMKVKHYVFLKNAIDKHINTLDGKFDTSIEEVESSYKRLGFTPKRFRWDMLWGTKRTTGLKIGDGVGMSGLPLYEYLNDDHIDTALRKHFSDLGLEWAASK